MQQALPGQRFPETITGSVALIPPGQFGRGCIQRYQPARLRPHGAPCQVFRSTPITLRARWTEGLVLRGSRIEHPDALGFVIRNAHPPLDDDRARQSGYRDGTVALTLCHLIPGLPRRRRLGAGNERGCQCGQQCDCSHDHLTFESPASSLVYLDTIKRAVSAANFHVHVTTKVIHRVRQLERCTRRIAPCDAGGNSPREIRISVSRRRSKLVVSQVTPQGYVRAMGSNGPG